MTKTSTGRYGKTAFTDSAAERDRLTELATVFDPYSTRYLDALAPAPGWRCLEVGPGVGTITRWLAGRAAPGEVVAVDRDTTPFGEDVPSNVVLLERDVTEADAMSRLGGFDLVHVRLVLMHLPERVQVLRSLTTLVKPGGLMVITDGVPLPCRTLTSEAMDLLWTRVARLAGTDPNWARTFPEPMVACGLVDIELAVDVPIMRGTSPYARFMKATLEQLYTGPDSPPPAITAYARLLDDPTYVDWPFVLITNWGRRPPAAGDVPRRGG